MASSLLQFQLHGETYTAEFEGGSRVPPGHVAIYLGVSGAHGAEPCWVIPFDKQNVFQEESCMTRKERGRVLSALVTAYHAGYNKAKRMRIKGESC